MYLLGRRLCGRSHSGTLPGFKLLAYVFCASNDIDIGIVESHSVITAKLLSFFTFLLDYLFVAEAHQSRMDRSSSIILLDGLWFFFRVHITYSDSGCVYYGSQSIVCISGRSTYFLFLISRSSCLIRRAMVRVLNSARDFHQNQVAPFPVRDDGRLGPEYKGTAADVEHEPIVLVAYGWMMPYLEPGQGDSARYAFFFFLSGTFLHP